MSESARELSFVASALLDQGRKVDRLSCGVTTAAIAVIAIVPPLTLRPQWTLIAFAVAAVMCGLAETYLAIRVGFDALLFHRVAHTGDLVPLDAALGQLRLLPAEKSGRAVEMRIAGARRLFRFQVLALAAQLACLLLGAVSALLST